MWIAQIHKILQEHLSALLLGSNRIKHFLLLNQFRWTQTQIFCHVVPHTCGAEHVDEGLKGIALIRDYFHY